MADMDELFGSDGDSDNDQRGNYPLILHNHASSVSGYLTNCYILSDAKIERCFAKTLFVIVWLIVLFSRGLFYMVDGMYKHVTNCVEVVLGTCNLMDC